jgi:hypothetical protein
MQKKAAASAHETSGADEVRIMLTARMGYSADQWLGACCSLCYFPEKRRLVIERGDKRVLTSCLRRRRSSHAATRRLDPDVIAGLIMLTRRLPPERAKISNPVLRQSSDIASTLKT